VARGQDELLDFLVVQDNLVRESIPEEAVLRILLFTDHLVAVPIMAAAYPVAVLDAALRKVDSKSLEELALSYGGLSV